MNALFCSDFYEAMYTISLIFKVFDPKLDHPKVIGINRVYTRVNLNSRNRKHDTQSRKTAIGPISTCTFEFSMTRTIWSKTGSFCSQCHQRCLCQSQPSYYISETCKIHIWASNQKYFTLFFVEAVHRISPSYCIWSKTGSPDVNVINYI